MAQQHQRECEAPAIGWEWDLRYMKHREVTVQMV